MPCINGLSSFSPLHLPPIVFYFMRVSPLVPQMPPTKNKRHKNLQNPLEFQCRKTFDVIAPPIPLDAIWEIVGFWVPFFGYQEKQFRATMQSVGKEGTRALSKKKRDFFQQ